MKFPMWTKLSSAFLLVALLVAFMGYVSTQGMITMNERFNEIVDYDVPRVQALFEIKTAEHAIKAHIADYKLRIREPIQNTDAITEKRDALFASIEELRKWRAHYEAFSDPENAFAQDVLQKLAASERDVIRIANQLVIILENPATPSFEGEEKTRELEIREQELESLIETSLIKEVELLREKERTANILTGSIERAALIISIIAFIISILIGIITASLIARPMRKILDTVREITKGNFAKKVAIPSRDEIGDLGRAVNEMASSLEETKRSMMNLLSDARALEGSLKTERDRIKAILASMGEGLFVVDKDCVITLVNPAAEIMLEIRSDKLLGADIRRVFTVLKGKTPLEDKDHPVTKSVKEGRIAIVGIEDNIVWHTPAGKKFPVATVSAPLVVENTITGAVVIFRDISAEKALDESKRTFISIASHQLRTPLTSIRWYAEMLESGDAGPLNKNQKAFLAQIYSGVLRLAETLNILLSLARIEGGRVRVEVTPINLAALTEEIIKEFRVAIEDKELEVKIKKSRKKIPEITLDATIARQVITNLLANAIRYTDKHGSITIALEAKEKEAVYSMRDNGIGIPEDQKEKIFEKFFRADNAINKAPDGTGLGLALVYQLVGLWKGKIWFESKEEKGTTFFITIPYAGMHASSVGKEILVGK